MLEAANLIKFYGARQALAGVSFSAEPGEAVAVLGMEGSGKTSLMRIFSGFLAPTHGTVRAGGGDPRRAAARRGIGYFVSGNPLPLQSRTGDYLRFRAGLKGVPSPASAAAEAAALCGIEGALGARIGKLAPEEKARAGLAECVLADPPVLLLDDPLSGLPPEEGKRLRGLLGEIMTGRAVLFACGSLEDADALCRRAVILDQGRVVADGGIAAIRDRNIEERVIALEIASREPVREALRSVPGVRGVSVTRQEGGLAVRVTTPAGLDLRQKLTRVCGDRGWVVCSMRLEPVRVEDMFPKIAARATQTRRMP